MSVTESTGCTRQHRLTPGGRWRNGDNGIHFEQQMNSEISENQLSSIKKLNIFQTLHSGLMGEPFIMEIVMSCALSPLSYWQPTGVLSDTVLDT